MLNRKAYAKLVKWTNTMPSKALLVDGARQTGKTYLIEQFAEQEFEDYLKVDFLRDEQAPYVSEAQNAQDLIERLSLMHGREVTPGRTLVFLDEVQEAPNLVMLSKYLVQDARFRLVMSGSLLGVELGRVRSLPVGFMHVERMFPLDFEEFCRSQGVTDSLWDTIGEHFSEREPLEASLHDRLVRLFRIYLVVGGMPEAVQRYIDKSGDLGAVRDLHRDLVRLYRDDISKHAGNRTLQVMSIFDAIPSQLDKENKRFELKRLKTKATFERFANDFAWLVAAGAALKTASVTEPKCPLRRTEEDNRFKLYQSDTGMLVSRYPLEVAMAIIAGEKDVNSGSIYENYVAQELVAARVTPRYFRRSGMGEVDFIGETSGRAIVPIEVKSGKTYKRHVALNNLLGSDEYRIEEGFVLSEANVSTAERAGKPVQYLPLYMTPFLVRQLTTTEVDSEDELSRSGLAEGSMIVPPPSFEDFER